MTHTYCVLDTTFLYSFPQKLNCIKITLYHFIVLQFVQYLIKFLFKNTKKNSLIQNPKLTELQQWTLIYRSIEFICVLIYIFKFWHYTPFSCAYHADHVFPLSRSSSVSRLITATII